jgi:uncharacterized protein YndB with AHSA1/START domain
MSNNVIKKQILIRATHGRVWKALADSKEFGEWFGVALEGPFVAGKTVSGVIIGTLADKEVAELQKVYNGKRMDLVVEAIQPERRLALRWHPHAIEEGVDYSKEPTTLIEFTLEDVEGGVMVTVTETGFDKIPAERRAKAFEANSGGWEIMVKVLDKYVTHKK